MPPLRKSKLRSFEDLYNIIAGEGQEAPRSLDVERSVLGAMLINTPSISKIVDVIGIVPSLEESPFYSEAHTYVYQAITDLDRNGLPVDLLTVTNELRQRGKLEFIGGAAYIVELSSSCVTTAHVTKHAKIIIEKHIARETIRVAEQTKLRAFLGKEDPFDLLSEAQQELSLLSDIQYRGKGFQEGSVIGFEAVDHLESIQNREDGITGAPSGLDDIDRMTAGWQKANLIILAARPSQGKTALSISFAKHLAFHPDLSIRKTVAYFSLEMSSQALIMRMIASMAGIDMQNMRKGQMTNEDWRKFSSAILQMKAAGTMLIDDTSAITVDAVRAKLRGLVQRLATDRDKDGRKRPELGLVLIDYLQLLELAGHWDSEMRKRSEVSKMLKAMAKYLNVPIIALSQLNREVDKRKDNRPVLSDLRETGQIEQDADVVMFIFRPETYGILTDDKGISTEDIAEIIMGKQRDGPIGDLKVHFNKRTQQFSNKEATLFGDAQQEAF